MRQFPVVFDDLTTNMVEAGETGGILDIILQRMAIYVEKAVKLRAAIKSALIYPVAVVSLAVLIVGALLKWVVPIFANLFVGLGVALPLPTRIVIGLSDFVGQFWWFFIVGTIAAVFRYQADSEAPAWPLLLRCHAAQAACPRHAAAQDRSRPLYSKPWARSSPPAFRFSKAWPSPPAPRATPCWKKR